VGFFLIPTSGSALFLTSYHSHAATSGNGERQIGIANEERPEQSIRVCGNFSIPSALAIAVTFFFFFLCVCS
jgi:hypothetical protein